MSKGTDATVVGAVIGTIVGVAPRVYDRITGRRHEDADSAALVGAGAGSVTAAAMALLDQVQGERTTCQAALTAANERIDAGVIERTELRREIADLRSQVATLRAFQTGP